MAVVADNDPRRANAAGMMYYVSPFGSDGNSGTSADDAWGTVSHALDSLFPGDTLFLRGGVYVENITASAIRPGTAEAPILVRNYPGEQPVIQGLLSLRNPSWWTLDGVNVTWNDANSSTGHMVKVTNGIGWTIRNSEFWGARAHSALLVAGTVPGRPSNWTVTGNCIHDTYPSNETNQDQLIYVNTGLGSGPGTVQNNLLFNATNGMGVKLGGPSLLSGGASNVLVSRNTIHNTSQNLLVAWNSHSNTIERNIFSRAHGNYSNARGYRLAGPSNAMQDNLGYAARSILLNDAGYLGIRDAGGNQFPVDPGFNDTGSCAGFRPLNPGAAGYGYRSS